ncbi:MAG: DNA starvation/stationary phase protection protein [Verrucomicrobiales bacterium]|nr:DNA starvation/stationary phase protection protein [Verrucomicrobiales bacterium]
MKTTPTIADEISDGLNNDQRTRVVEILTSVLSNQHVLYIKLRNFHWNLKGPRFHSLHEFFEQLYGGLEKAIDETAERIRMLGGVAPGSMEEFLEHASLKEAAGAITNGDDAISTLVTDQEAVIRDLREFAKETEEECEDQATGDFLVELLQQHVSDAWMLRSFRSEDES